jgi:RNA polymerase sigma-70 factor (ECF subfamily)
MNSDGLDGENLKIYPMSQLEKLSDPELMGHIAGGATEAFSALVRRHQQSLVNFFRRFGVYNEAEDLAQETFVRIFRYRSRYRPTAKFTTFLYMLARQVRLDLFRKTNRREKLDEELFEAAQDEERLGARIKRTSRVEVDACLARLSDPLREVIVLSIYQDLRNQEIADVLEIPLGTVKSRLFNALRELRRMINEGKK